MSPKSQGKTLHCSALSFVKLLRVQPLKNAFLEKNYALITLQSKVPLLSPAT